jgi:hypothetical protein
MPIPGVRFLAFASRWFDAATVTRVFEPLVADWQREWIDASTNQRAWIRLRGTSAFVVSVLMLTPRLMFLAPPPRAMTRRVLARTIIFTSIVSLLLAIPVVLELRERSLPHLVICAILLLPSGAALGFPFSMLWAADGIRRHSRPTPAERAAALRYGAIGVIFSFALVGWIFPAANQQFREIAAPESFRPPARGIREVTLRELAMDPPPPILQGRDAATLQRELNKRIMLGLLPGVLLWLRWGAHASARKGRLWSLPVAVETVLAMAIFLPVYYLSVVVEPALGLRAGTGMWLAPAILIAAGAARQARLRSAGSHA